MAGLFQHFTQTRQFIGAIGCARRVRWRMQEHPLGPGRDRCLKLRRSDLVTLRRACLDKDRRTAREIDDIGIAHPIRRWNDDLVTCINRRDQCVEEGRSEEHTSELQSLMRTSYAVFCLKNTTTTTHITILQ